MSVRVYNTLIILGIASISLFVQSGFTPLSEHLPPMFRRFVLGWGLWLSIGVVGCLALRGLPWQRLFLLLSVPCIWFVWHWFIRGLTAGALPPYALYLLYSTGFMVIGFVLAQWYRRMRDLSRQR